MVKKQIKRKPQQTNWLGGSLSLNPAHRTLVKRNDVFKTNSKYVMSNMFKDSDRDGVLNAFDCKPRNKQEQGLIDNLVKFVKGKKKKNPEEEVKTISTKDWRNAQRQKAKAAKNQAIIDRAKAGMKADARAKQRERAIKISSGVNRISSGVNRFGNQLALSIARANPKYDMQIEKRVVGLQPMSKLARKKLNLDYEMMRRARVSRQQLVGGGASPRANTLTRSIGMVFPQAAPRTASGKAVGVPGQRGRPRGSLDPRYAAYGGVFQYRKAMALRKKAAKFAKQQAELQVKMSGQPQYETQQYQQQVQEQVPQETPGAVPDYQQFQEEIAQNQPEVVYEPAQEPQQQVQQVVYQQPQQQYTPETYKRPVVPVFKSSGGSPYGTKAPIVQQSLAPSNSYGDYIEYADAFTGERKWKKKIQPEGWSKPKDQNQEPIVKQSWMGNR